MRRSFSTPRGEWYLDRVTGALAYWPRPGEHPDRRHAVAPVVAGPLVTVAGTPSRPVVNLHFRGLHVEHADWPLPAHGHAGLFCRNVPVLREAGPPGHRFIGAAVEIAHARACSFRDGGIARVGGMGIVLREGTADVTVEGNEIHHTGAGFYASFAHRGTPVRANLIHDSSGRPMSGGICLDGCTG